MSCFDGIYINGDDEYLKRIKIVKETMKERNSLDNGL